MDSVVLMGGCDKTVPAELMAAASADIPAIQLVVGPMTAGSYKGERLGACTDCRRMWTELRIGKQEITEINTQLAPSAGTCMVMGTASTMACVVEAMGMSLPLAGTAPSVSADRLRLSTATGRQAVELAKTLESALDLDVLTVTGQTLREQLAAAEGPQKWQDTIRRLDDPL